MAYEEREEFPPDYLTVEQIIALYRKEDRPLSRETILASLEPLAGTSFLAIAIAELRRDILERRPAHQEGIRANDLYSAFFGSSIHEPPGEQLNLKRQIAAIIALHSLSAFAVGLNAIYEFSWLKAGEMMLHESRWDDIYADKERTQKVFTQNVSQWRFYKDGHYLHALANSRISYFDSQGQFHFYSFLPEGVYYNRFFVDGRRRAIASLHPEQQEFHHGYRMLYISSNFSFEQARRK